jgi:hypothetical protein
LLKKQNIHRKGAKAQRRKGAKAQRSQSQKIPFMQKNHTAAMTNERA